MPPAPLSPVRPLPVLAVALALALASAVSLGLARFSYALLLPPMRADLGWTYLTSGTMNTANAAGYLIGALAVPGWLRRWGARRLLLVGSAGTGWLLVGHGMVTSDTALYALRVLTGIGSAATFVAGGLLAARLGGRAAAPAAGADAASAGASPASASASASPSASASAGLVLGIFYGGTGVGIVVSTLLVPGLSSLARPHAWQYAWYGLGLTALASTPVTAWATRGLEPAGGQTPSGRRLAWSPLAPALASYFLFGLGYIGYMTFVVTLLREQGASDDRVAAFYGLLGVAVIGSSWLWATLLQRSRGGRAMGLLNGLLALATVLPVTSAAPLVVFASGALFGGVFLSVVASTTAFVRHNLTAASWPAGIAAFTTVFAAGQIVGPIAIGWVADGPGGLRAGFVGSAVVLALAAVLAARQKALQGAGD